MAEESSEERWFAPILSGLKKVWKTLSPQGSNEVVKVVYACPYCHNPLLSNYGGCDHCQFKYTNEFQSLQQYSESDKKDLGVCKHPNCGKPCYYEVSSGRVHDYCGRTHATEHRKMIEEYDKQQMKRKYQGSHSGFGHHQSFNFPVFSYSTASYNPTSLGHTDYNSRSQAESQSGPIYFYNRDEPYYEFTNFYDQAPIVLDDVQWWTTEHYFQAQKFVGTPYVEWIRRLGRPREAFDLSRDPQVSRWRRSDWEDVKVNVMYKALLAKFSQHEYLRKMLLATGERHLIEHTHRDSFWGDGGNGSGQNRLGKLLMKVREGLRGGKKERGSTPRETSVDTDRKGGHTIPPQDVGSSANKRMRVDSSPPSTRASQDNQSNKEIDSKATHSSEDNVGTKNCMESVKDLIDLTCEMDTTPPLVPLPTASTTQGASLVGTQLQSLSDSQAGSQVPTSLDSSTHALPSSDNHCLPPDPATTSGPSPFSNASPQKTCPLQSSTELGSANTPLQSLGISQASAGVQQGDMQPSVSLTTSLIETTPVLQQLAPHYQSSSTCIDDNNNVGSDPGSESVDMDTDDGTLSHL